MSRIAVARIISTLGHPVVLMLAAALGMASARGASPTQLRFVGVALATLAFVVVGFSWLQVRSGSWQHVDASGTKERASLNGFLVALLSGSALVVWILTRRPDMPVALASAALLIVVAILAAPWVKISLHAAFAAFATVLLWSMKLAFMIGILVTGAIMWSRLVLGRHKPVDVIAGLLVGFAIGSAYQWWAA
jgi:membrane-associated phospholipid phosphatase